jgi:acetyl esterase
MPVDPQVEAFLRQAAAAGAPSYETMAPADARAVFAGRPSLAGPPESVAQVDETAVPGPRGSIPVRVYTPEGVGPFPVLMYFHGGGWVLGNLETSDGPCRALARRAGCVVVSVDYGLAPEHKFPAPLEDCYSATQHVADRAGVFGVDPSRLAVGGDSAGGNLAAAVTLMARDRGGPPIVFQMLNYPITDYSFDTPSYSDYADGYSLTRGAMVWYWSHYLRVPEDGRHPYASVLRARDLSGLPPALIMTAELDPLRDEGESYAARLRSAGVQVDLRRLDGMIHGFFRMAGVFDQAKEALDGTAQALRGALSAPAPAASLSEVPRGG